MNSPEEVSRIGANMKGFLVGGVLYGWDVNAQGYPHHDDYDPDGRREIQFAHIDKFMSMDGSSSESIRSISDILGFFSGYKDDSEIHMNVGFHYRDIEFKFDGAVRDLKSFFKLNPAPDPEDYDDGTWDDEFLKDYRAWTRSVKDKKIVRQILGRGGPDDSWQDKDEDWSKSFSVYNNPPKLNTAFWKWFGDSKIVDSDGNPLVVYHGTAIQKNKFRRSGGCAGCGAYFTHSRADAEDFADRDAEIDDGFPIVISAYLSIRNPYHTKSINPARAPHGTMDPQALTAEHRDLLEARGYDGIIIDNTDEIVAFDSTQIKAIDNDGTWDLDDPNIRSNPTGGQG